MALTTCLRLFISYSHQDQDFALAVEQRLAGLGQAVDGQALVDVWLDRHDITAGHRWRGAIKEGLCRADVVILITSPDALASRYVVREVRTALQDRSKPDDCLLPLRYRAVEPDRLRWAARQFGAIVTEFQWIDLTDIASPFTEHPNLLCLDDRIERYWQAKIERQRSPTWKLADEKRFICDLFQLPHDWAARYLSRRVHDLMDSTPPNPSRAQYDVHALKFIAAPHQKSVLNDLVTWWRARFTDRVTTALLEQALGLEKPPACY
jgi:hypothetical protein